MSRIKCEGNTVDAVPFWELVLYARQPVFGTVHAVDSSMVRATGILSLSMYFNPKGEKSGVKVVGVNRLSLVSTTLVIQKSTQTS